MNPKDYTLHSGGANGSDFQFEIIGREFGVINFNHYWYGKMNPHSLTEHKITEEDYLEGVEMVHKANTIMKRQGYEKYMNLLARNWSQCKYSDAVYAISTLKNNKIVNGGTGWCVAFAQLTDKELYVYDQDKEQWYYWNNGIFIVCTTPKLTKNYAGIGTRKINDAGILAIRNVYKRTFTN